MVSIGSNLGMTAHISAFLIILWAGFTSTSTPDGKDDMHAHFTPSPMVTLKGGQFKIGVNDPRTFAGEHGIKRAEVKPFKIDRYPVTNGDFAMFKQDKKRYYTTSETGGFSYVFYSQTLPEDRQDTSKRIENEPWWYPVHGATWYHPEGPKTDIKMRPDHPVVHVSWHDARAFCQWAGKRLLTEYEWEFAARGGLVSARYPWGEHFKRNRTNLWQGLFPMENHEGDGYYGVSPVNAYGPQNAFGMYDMVGNVWEWTATRYVDPKHGKNVDRRTLEIQYVVKGGSFIDSRDGRFNVEARCAARKGHKPEYTAQNLGFRCGQNFNPETMKLPPTTRPPPPKVTREPKTHYLNETWSYKLGKMFHRLVLGDKPQKRLVLGDKPQKREDL